MVSVAPANTEKIDGYMNAGNTRRSGTGMGKTRPLAEVAEIERLDLRDVFPREDYDFTPWLCEPGNLDRLSRALGFDLEFVSTETRSSTYRTDIIARNASDSSRVIIENQFRRSDHDHLGKCLTYLAAHQASAVIWIAESFSGEHRAALTWLNDNTSEEVGFFAVAPDVIRIADSPPALDFRVVIAPNNFVKRVKQDDQKIDASISPLREAFWQAFEAKVAEDEVLSMCRQRYGGKLGFKWLIPDVKNVLGEEPPHVLVWLNTPSHGQQAVGYSIHPANSSGSRLEALCDTAWSATEQRLRSAVDLGTIGRRREILNADLSSDNGLNTATHEVLPRVRTAYEELVRGIDERLTGDDGAENE